MWMRHLLIAAVMVGFLVTPTLAVDVDPAPEGNQWVPVVIAMLLVICVMTSSFMSSRRGHQD